ncbi:hypothetical protein CLV24_1118 [Pontibacter ummariensis]|uniref:Uncharacterized protein n=1 Tax=Pontibacter ummariensis TaxID=1610492 RepID=A0A239GDK1_9BACT|nr:hypothetical protein [Pontibacter ummariensis]PRY11213.1 hypothetical protein CLV24_1118 [Pontibacter ummariensis]SNS67200.1 hypothetical protein SAMN06296052_1118 [Pontibacter ummariensis]
MSNQGEDKKKQPIRRNHNNPANLSEENVGNRPDKVNDEYNERMTLGNHPDPTAKRNMGSDGQTERRGQKDKLENLHIGGNEVSGYGDNNHRSVESFAQGPGFEYEGSDTAMDDDVAGVRRGDQPLGEDKKKEDDADYGRR